PVAAARPGGGEVRAGADHAHGGGGVGRVDAAAVGRRPAHGQHAVVGGRIRGHVLVVGAGDVARGGHHDDVGGQRPLDGGPQRRMVGGPDGDIDHICAGGDRVVDRVDELGDVAFALVALLVDNELGVRGDAVEGNAGQVVGADVAGDGGAVAGAVVVAGVRLFDELGVAQLRMAVVDAAVDDGDGDPGAGGQLPGGLDVEPFLRPRLTGGQLDRALLRFAVVRRGRRRGRGEVQGEQARQEDAHDHVGRA